MPISTSNFGDTRDDQYSEYQSEELYDQETLDFPDVTLKQAQTYLKRLGGGLEDNPNLVEGIGWKAEIAEADNGVEVTFDAHDELLDDLIRRFEEWVDRGD
ncbi:MAG: hypothetical protein AAF639_33485 [Chloroflexota bacterium]